MSTAATAYRLSPSRPTRDTLGIMASLIRKRRADPIVRSTALSIVKGAQPYDDNGRMSRVLSWVKGSMPYERDPRDVEAINDPLLSINKISAYGRAAGDCDDAATLIATLLESVGVQTHLVAVSVRADRRLHHVGVKAFDRRGNVWRYLDPFSSSEVGRRPQFTNALEVAV